MGVDLHTQVKERFPSKEALVWIRSLPSSGSQLSERLSVCSCQFVFTLSVESLLKLGEDEDRLLWRRTLMHETLCYYYSNLGSSSSCVSLIQSTCFISTNKSCHTTS